MVQLIISSHNQSTICVNNDPDTIVDNSDLFINESEQKTIISLE